MRNILIKDYKTNVTNKRTRIWNNELIITLNINLITTLTNDDYVNFYDENKIVLIPSYLDNDKKKPYYFTNYSCMIKTNYKIIELLKKKKQKTEEQNKRNDKKVNDSRMKDDEYNYDMEEDDDEDDEPKCINNYCKYKD